MSFIPQIKIEEFYDITKAAGPELATKYINLHKQVFGVENPEDTLEHWIHFKDIVCAMPEEQRKKGFNEWCALVGEHMLEICTDPLSEVCQKAELAADQFAVLLTKYEASGVCAETPEGVPEGMMPAGMGKMPSSPFG
ncbi:hypothetical protein AVEN_116581-1 [Araneus ventricosus]|uniref:Uncharacterized protein n=1 Tax=Araneus ventricosus TaxID=182803 RepID=A0A4Y2HQS8_ARAVE|nr:hypothetical protein AVEN_116581-1 [Araneus ventricosus]